MKLLPRGGWKPKLSDTMLHHLKLLFITNQLSSPRQAKNYISENFQISVSERTLRRRLEKMGIKRYTKNKRPGLTQAQMKERKHFAKSREDWTEDQWDKVIFVDETTVYTYEYFGNRYYWTTKEIEEKHLYVIETAKFKGHSFKLWAGICGSNKTRMIECPRGLTSDQYIQILSEEVLPLIQNRVAEMLLHDKCTSHTSRKTKNWLNEHGVETILLPTNSPDLNPIENVWHLLKHRISMVNTKSFSTAQLKEETHRQWDALSSGDFEGLIQ